ncbi:hypothetical protein AALB_0047 [Agarivorans albus MKT 106]|uniref:Uncharacterized protein n=1 Tax=Agarivorans albus MKT 106 TaxID=1331007 RepID=R9PF39_AGAAL|nr:hypothetical protein AALB_0047 [Agarivorans albus MKT 106]
MCQRKRKAQNEPRKICPARLRAMQDGFVKWTIPLNKKLPF